MGVTIQVIQVHIHLRAKLILVYRDKIPLYPLK